MRAEQYFVEQAKFNKWLFELTPEEAKHILWMLNDFAEAENKALTETLKEIERTVTQGAYSSETITRIISKVIDI